MQKVLTFLDNIAGILIVVFCLGTILQICGLYIWKFPLNEHGTQELLTAAKFIKLHILFLVSFRNDFII